VSMDSRKWLGRARGSGGDRLVTERGTVDGVLAAGGSQLADSCRQRDDLIARAFGRRGLGQVGSGGAVEVRTWDQWRAFVLGEECAGLLQAAGVMMGESPRWWMAPRNEGVIDVVWRGETLTLVESEEAEIGELVSAGLAGEASGRVKWGDLKGCITAVFDRIWSTRRQVAMTGEKRQVERSEKGVARKKKKEEKMRTVAEKNPLFGVEEDAVAQAAVQETAARITVQGVAAPTAVHGAAAQTAGTVSEKNPLFGVEDDTDAEAQADAQAEDRPLKFQLLIVVLIPAPSSTSEGSHAQQAQCMQIVIRAMTTHHH
jgi:hypothetical protein